MENEPSDTSFNIASRDYYDSSISHRVVLIGGHNKQEWVFLGLCISSITLLLTCSVFSLSDCPVNYPAVKNLDYLIIISACISLLFAIHGIFHERQHEIYMHSLLLFLALLFSWIRFAIDTNCYYVFKLIANITECIVGFSAFFLALKATHVPDWVEFQIVGVSDVLTVMYKQICFLLALLKFDSVFMVLLAFYSAQITYSFKSDYWYIYQVDIVFYAFLSWLCGKLAITFENISLVYGFYLLSVSYGGLIIYQINATYFHSCLETLEICAILKYTTIFFAFLALVSKIVLMHQMFKSSQKFGHGLKTDSFNDLVTRNSSNLLSRSRSALIFSNR